MLLGITTTLVYANSAQSHWDGMDATGVVVSSENGDVCPIMVEGEVLTFDIPTFPKEYYREKEEYLSYAAKVTAEYTFYNPADYTVNATLVFPFGMYPDYRIPYDRETEKRIRMMDTEKYEILINGEAIGKELRHTICFWGSRFELEKDLAKLDGETPNSDFYSPALPVTKYIFQAKGVESIHIPICCRLHRHGRHLKI